MSNSRHVAAAGIDFKEGAPTFTVATIAARRRRRARRV